MLKLDTRKILVPMDFSDTAMYALRHACFLAQYTKGEVFLLHVIAKNHEVYNVVQPELNLDLNMKNLGTALEKRLEVMAFDLKREYGINITTEVTTGNVAMEIVKAAEDTKCGLVVMGTQGYSALEMIFIGSITMKVLGAAKIPVMSVRTPAHKHGYKNIVLPIDSSQHSRQKVNIAIELCHDFGAHLHVIGMTDSDDSNFEMKLNVIFRQIEEYAEKRNVVCSHKLVENPPNKAKATLAFADEVKSDLILIMSDQDVEYTGIFLGPYASQVINYAKMPVLTIMPEDINDITFSTPGVAGW